MTDEEIRVRNDAFFKHLTETPPSPVVQKMAALCNEYTRARMGLDPIPAPCQDTPPSPGGTTMSEIKSHMAKVASDVNRKIKIEGSDPCPGGADTVFKVAHDAGPGHIDLVFQTAQTAGLTNEVLLAIVEARLNAFQHGPLPCPENGTALHGVRAALHALKARTERRAVQGIEGKPEEKVAETKRVEASETRLRIDDTVVDIKDLAMWGKWDTVTKACLKLDPPPTPAEMEVISNAAAHLGNGARNGLTELKSALASISKPKKPAA